jgi:hypothetical protein
MKPASISRTLPVRLLSLLALLLPAQARQWTPEEAMAWGNSKPWSTVPMLPTL